MITDIEGKRLTDTLEQAFVLHGEDDDIGRTIALTHVRLHNGKRAVSPVTTPVNVSRKWLESVADAVVHAKSKGEGDGSPTNIEEFTQLMLKSALEWKFRGLLGRNTGLFFETV